MALVPVILAGGQGTRLWPESRADRPKQFLDLTGAGLSLFQQTLLRACKLPDCGRLIVVTHNAYRFQAAEHIQALGLDVDLLLEPEARHTTAAITSAALHALASQQDATLLYLPADHIIQDESSFIEAVTRSLAAAQSSIVTFGVVPDYPATGYGYIRPDQSSGDAPYPVQTFIEKPDSDTANVYIQQGYLWNAGIFLGAAEVFLQEVRHWVPETYQNCSQAYKCAVRDLDFLRLDAEAYQNIAPQGFDHSVMENTDKARVLPVSMGWSDIGSWEGLLKAEGGGNASERIYSLNTSNSLIRSSGPAVATVGIDNQIIVVTEDAVLVMGRQSADQLPQLLQIMQAAGERTIAAHSKRYAPWGSQTLLLQGDQCAVKQLQVKVGHRLSLQSHRYRNENWVVVSGCAQVTVDAQEQMLHRGQSVYVPAGSRHRLANPGAEPLIIIEVQTWSEQGSDDPENDIVRYDDDYNRHE
ncbi:mannose-1-phosphate guanylyltransferase/mannose-6-phosphate isomerase [Parendozoicomonas haliclonae]|uniref:mannose-1-phosphate guanylyltransferase n=1 Tax=Parendozoicomonas haliclonae TaxID=1960125 RepID=A0A1X7AL35_9GAMM|nr:mannose-1-phosphate guanylyltransferase/mannose-6-phosphate isomerase [Parendozoicomonas haliclonae]SMA47966.1 Mannose-1-phosphate guanylyltransferase 1 [Parendozoicomonas haliclonae]